MSNVEIKAIFDEELNFYKERIKKLEKALYEIKELDIEKVVDSYPYVTIKPSYVEIAEETLKDDSVKLRKSFFIFNKNGLAIDPEDVLLQQIKHHLEPFKDDGLVCVTLSSYERLKDE